MNKNIFRAIFLITILIWLLFFLKPIDPIYFLNNSLFGRLITVIFVFGIIYLWGFMFYHWGTHNFNNKTIKILWFWSMIVGLYAGALIYYIVVYELKKTLKTKQDRARNIEG